jgi:WhiB family redox-sensing transcriptional regulator
VSIAGIVELPREQDADWREDAICAQVDLSAFFPEKGENSAEAKQLCITRCSVREQCLELAIVNNERFGIWGGLSTKERDNEIVRRQQESDDEVAGRRNLKMERRDRMIVSMSAVGDDATFISRVVGVDPRTVRRVIANHEVGGRHG